MFGGLYSVAVTAQDRNFNDPNIFVFSFESHGRCKTPQRFALRECIKHCSAVGFNANNPHRIVYCCQGWLNLGNRESSLFCGNLSQYLEGIQDTTLTGENASYHHGPFYHNTRLIAIQLT